MNGASSRSSKPPRQQSNDPFREQRELALESAHFPLEAISTIVKPQFPQVQRSKSSTKRAEAPAVPEEISVFLAATAKATVMAVVTEAMQERQRRRQQAESIGTELAIPYNDEAKTSIKVPAVAVAGRKRKRSDSEATGSGIGEASSGSEPSKPDPREATSSTKQAGGGAGASTGAGDSQAGEAAAGAPEGDPEEENDKEEEEEEDEVDVAEWLGLPPSKTGASHGGTSTAASAAGRAPALASASSRLRARARAGAVGQTGKLSGAEIRQAYMRLYREGRLPHRGPGAVGPSGLCVAGAGSLAYGGAGASGTQLW